MMHQERAHQAEMVFLGNSQRMMTEFQETRLNLLMREICMLLGCIETKDTERLVHEIAMKNINLFIRAKNVLAELE
jgi:hypothetical protein